MRAQRGLTTYHRVLDLCNEVMSCAAGGGQLRKRGVGGERTDARAAGDEAAGLAAQPDRNRPAHGKRRLRAVLLRWSALYLTSSPMRN